MVEHILRVEGSDVSEGRPSPTSIGNVLRQIGYAARESVRMGFRHSSRIPGRQPGWLSAAENVRFTGLSASATGETLLRFEAPRFGEVAEEPYREPNLFETPPAPSDSAFDILGDILNEIRIKATDSELYDIGLLKRFEKFNNTVFRYGVSSITIQGNRYSLANAPRIDNELSQTAAMLHREIPSPKRVRVMGKLDMIRDSDRVFNLILESGERLHGVWTGGDTGTLGAFFRKNVAVGGVAIFRPSGTLLRVDAEAMALAGEKDNFFSVVPKSTPRELEVPALIRSQKRKGGIAAVFGKWPGDESEEQLLTVLKELD